MGWMGDVSGHTPPPHTPRSLPRSRGTCQVAYVVKGVAARRHSPTLCNQIMNLRACLRSWTAVTHHLSQPYG
jgi:hypothetical protein